MDDEQQAPDWKQSLPAFAQTLSRGLWEPYQHLIHICEQIVGNLEGGRFIINMPPRHGKSELISHWLPAWYLEACPDRWVILCSYESKVASDWGRSVRDTFNEPELWTSVRQDVSAINLWKTPEGGGMIAVGAGGPITGRGGHLMVIDDPYKNWEQAHSATYRKNLIRWFQSTFYTRKEPNATIIVVQTRWHQHDLTGWLLEEHDDDWVQISLPAIAEANDQLDRPLGQALCSERYDKEALGGIKTGVGSRVWAGMYQQNPRPAEGSIIKSEWIRYASGKPKFDKIIQSWDMAFKDTATSSFVVGQVWGRAGVNYYLLDQWRERIDFVGSLRAVEEFTKKHIDAKGKLIEDKANGPAIMNALENKISGLIPITPQGGKEARAQAVAPLWEAGNVFIPSPDKFPWVEDYIRELTLFPSAAHDDQVDATTQALIYLDKRQVMLTGITFPSLTQSNPWSMLS